MSRASSRVHTPSRLLADFSKYDASDDSDEDKCLTDRPPTPPSVVDIGLIIDGGTAAQRPRPAKRRRAPPKKPPSDDSDDDAAPARRDAEQARLRRLDVAGRLLDLDQVRAAWAPGVSRVRFEPQIFEDGDGRVGAVLHPRGLPPQGVASDAGWAEAVAAGNSGHGLQLRDSEAFPNLKFLMRRVLGSGHDDTVLSFYRTGNPHATSVVEKLFRTAVSAEKITNAVFVPIWRSGATRALQQDRVYKLAQIATGVSSGCEFEAALISRNRPLDKFSRSDIEARRLHYASAEVIVDREVLVKYKNEDIWLVDDDVFSFATLAPIVSKLEQVIHDCGFNSRVRCLVVAECTHPGRMKPTLYELLPEVREMIRAASRRMLQSTESVRDAPGVDVALAYVIDDDADDDDNAAYTGSRMPSVQVSAEQGARMYEAFLAKKWDLVISIATEVLGSRADEHQSDALNNKHNSTFTAWLVEKLRTNPHLKLRDIIKPLAIIFNCKGESRQNFYQDGCLTLEQIHLLALRAAADSAPRRPSTV